MVATSMGYPDHRVEAEVLRGQIERKPLEEVEPVLGIREISEAREEVRRVQVHEEILNYAIRLAGATREHPAVSLGVSPRGSIALVRASQARAASRGRDFVGPEDVKALAPQVLTHRIGVRGGASGVTGRSVVEEALDSVTPPS